MENSSKTTEKLNKPKNQLTPWKNRVKRVKWFVLGGAFGEALDRLESKGVLDWAPMWDHYGRKDYDALGETGIEESQRQR